MAAKENDLERIEKLISIMKQNDLVEVEITHGEDRLLLKRAQASQPTITSIPMIGNLPSAAPVFDATQVAQGTSAESPADGLVEIKSPIVGTFYLTPSPDADAYVDVNSHIGESTIVCIVEAMKVMNEIKAETSGTIVEICGKSGEAVEYGQVLFRVKPD
jgi:acetyl-CoA carboxylase biotin carboxyl carrier protein